MFFFIVNATDADNLDLTCEGFPPLAPEFQSDGEIVALTENSTTLDLMFRFVYPRRMPNLDDVEFSVLASLAEAVEKYQVYTAEQLYVMFMEKALPGNAIGILDYFIKHGYPGLANKAAPLVTLAELSQRTVINSVSPELLRLWVCLFQKTYL
ncbi:hypothetical protein DXG03_002392 [Asterophora parasitica]|uniref:BTB domain-containing protein n=1 Tax=Asterophora parasitica TaxID=117018 RepID=A0A9P7K8G4_9AGAR|nr:hypothetical protein DXG03_002392 [Asterophora parasitica]